MEKGWTKVPNRFLRDPTITPQARCLLMILHSFAWEGDACHPSIETLAQLMDMSDRMIKYYLKELEDAGAIARTRKSGPGRFTLTKCNGLHLSASEVQPIALASATHCTSQVQPIARPSEEDAFEEDSVCGDRVREGIASRLESGEGPDGTIRPLAIGEAAKIDPDEEASCIELARKTGDTGLDSSIKAHLRAYGSAAVLHFLLKLHSTRSRIFNPGAWLYTRLQDWQKRGRPDLSPIVQEPLGGAFTAVKSQAEKPKRVYKKTFSEETLRRWREEGDTEAPQS